MLGEDVYCAVASVLLSSDVGKNLSLRQPRELLHCLRKKKKKERLIFYNKYHKCSIFYHCIIHQGPFCSRLSHLPAMLAVHTQQAKFICESMLLPHCAFQVFLQELDATRHGVFLHDNVRCLRKEGELKCSSGWEYTPRGSCPNNNIHSQ